VELVLLPKAPHNHKDISQDLEKVQLLQHLALKLLVAVVVVEIILVVVKMV
tara:strand:+ start:59 stop:211 length:153 start_codon:yes stop_codon:yes gene_type:complete